MNFLSELPFWFSKSTDTKPSSSSTIVLVLLLHMTLTCLCQMTFEETPFSVEEESENLLDSVKVSREEVQSLRELVSRLSTEVNRQRVELSDAVKQIEILSRKDDKQDADDGIKRLVESLASNFVQYKTQIQAENDEMRQKLEQQTEITASLLVWNSTIQEKLAEQIQTENDEMRQKLEQQTEITASLLVWNSTIQEKLAELEGKSKDNEGQIDVLREENSFLRTAVTELNQLRSTTNRTQEEVNELKRTNNSLQGQLTEVKNTLKVHEGLIQNVLQKNSVLEGQVPKILELNSSLLDLTLSQQQLRAFLEIYNLTLEEHFVETVRRGRDQEIRLEQANNSCFRGLNELRSENRQQLENLSRANTSESGNYEATYVRWGRKVCPTNATLIYSGYMAGSLFNQQGGGSNYLCVANQPLLGSNNKAGNQNAGSFLYGAEYEFSGSNSPFLTTNIGGGSFLNMNPPCVLCSTTAKSQQVMIPGRNVCPYGWRFQYRGYLVTAHQTHRKMDYLCLDEAPEVTPNSFRNENGALLYPVEVACGSLPCPPYGQGNEVTCVVCVM